MGRGRGKEKISDNERFSRAGIGVKQKILRLSGPLASPHVLHPKRLDLATEPEPRLRWMENVSLRLYPTTAENKNVTGCLQKFIRLHKKTDQQIRAFADEWGILGIWPVREWGEDNPCYDPAFDMWASYSSDSLSLLRREDQALNYQDGPQVRQFLWHTEKISLWRRLSRHFHAILLLAATLDDRGSDNTKDWEEVIIGGRPTFREQYMQTVITGQEPQQATPWTTLQYAIHRWTAQATITLLLGDRVKSGDYMAPAAHLDINQMPVDWTPEMYDECASKNYQDRQFNGDLTYYREERYLPMRSSVLLNILVVQLVIAVTSPLMVCQNPECGAPFNRMHAGKIYCDSKDCEKSRSKQRNALKRARDREAKAS